MNMKPFTLLAAAAVATVTATFANAEAYCPEMLSENTLERRYQRLAPIYNDVTTGWMFGSDQFDNRYTLKSQEEALLGQLVSELAEHGTDLAIFIAPPRPSVAGQEVVDATTGTPGLHNTAQQSAAFHQMIEQMSASGALVPDLLELLETKPMIREGFYFQRDTHWTNLGAAHSALALAQAVDPALQPAFDVSELPVVDITSERGSLSDIMDATCGRRPDAEQSPLLDYSTHLTAAIGLLDDTDTDQSNVVLLGTSFSDRYRRDQYQTAEALSAALGRTVTNRSVSGGGMIGPFETYVLSGDYMKDKPDLIIWEFPYTYQMNEKALRQLLGAVRSLQETPVSMQHELRGDQLILTMSDVEHATDLIGLRLFDATVREIKVRVMAEDGEDTLIRLRRKSRMDEIALLNDWWVDLSGIDFEAHSMTFEFSGDDLPDEVEILRAIVSG